MSEYGDRLKKAISYAKISQEELAKKAGIKQPSLNYLMHEAKRGSSKTDSLARICGVNAHWLATGKGEMTSNVEPAEQKPQDVPIISFVQAGEWTESVDLYEPGYAEEYVTRIVEGAHIYALRVVGDSMTAQSGISFPEGYLIHVQPQKCAENGDCIIAKIKGSNEVTFKQLKFDGDKPYLKPLNPDHKPIFDEFKILGKVVGASIQF